MRQKKKENELGVNCVCHILGRDDEHVEPLCPNDIYSNYSVLFATPTPPPLSISIQNRKKRKGRQGGGRGLWNTLTQANEREETRGRKHKETCTKKERRRCDALWRKYSSCGSSFPLESGKNCSAPLTQNTCGHITIQPRRPEVYGSLLGFGRRGIFCPART